MSRFGDDRPEHRVASAKTLGTVLHLHRGTPYVYQGEELGMTNSPFMAIEEYRDIESVNYYRDAVATGTTDAVVLASLAAQQPRPRAHPDAVGRLPARGLHRRASRGCRCTPTTPRVNAEAAEADPGSVLHHYRALIALRHRERVVVDGRFDLLLPDHEQLWAFTRTSDDDVLLVLANCSSEPVDVPTDGLPDARGRGGAARDAPVRGTPRGSRRGSRACCAWGRPEPIPGWVVRASRTLEAVQPRGEPPSSHSTAGISLVRDTDRHRPGAPPPRAEDRGDLGVRGARRGARRAASSSTGT